MLDSIADEIIKLAITKEDISELAARIKPKIIAQVERKVVESINEFDWSEVVYTALGDDIVHEEVAKAIRAKVRELFKRPQ
jgi:uncharacterized hydantoinase/oxoprolinase family protein